MGAPTINRFAHFHNKQAPRFNSRCWNPGTEAVDAFTVDWHDDNNWYSDATYIPANTVYTTSISFCRLFFESLTPTKTSAN